jgi:hypothetical protein
VHIRLPFGLGGIAFPIAYVSPFDAAGTVQFKDGSTDIGPPVPVIGSISFGGLQFLPRGRHSLTAVFTPANSAAFQPSTSNAKKFRF